MRVYIHVKVCKGMYMHIMCALVQLCVLCLCNMQKLCLCVYLLYYSMIIQVHRAKKALRHLMGQ